MRRKEFFIAISFLFTATATLFVFFLALEEQKTKVVFLNVGEGDAILLSSHGTQILIDGGREGKVLLSKLGRMLPFWDRTIEAVIATHPDADHIGGFPDLLVRYRVGRYLSSGAASETEIFKLLTKRLEETKTQTALIAEGSELAFHGGKLGVLFPRTALEPTFADDNGGSIVSRFTFGETSFLLTGDLPREESVLPDIAEIAVLKVAHHGSKYSTSRTFLDRVRPKEAVISVGKNRYGHPAPEVLENLALVGAHILRTDTGGDIVYVCNEKLAKCTRRE